MDSNMEMQVRKVGRDGSDRFSRTGSQIMHTAQKAAWYGHSTPTHLKSVKRFFALAVIPLPNNF